MKHELLSMAVLAAMAVLLTGCNQPPPDETVFDEQLDALERARNVEKELNDRAAGIGDQLDDAGDEEDPPH